MFKIAFILLLFLGTVVGRECYQFIGLASEVKEYAQVQTCYGKCKSVMSKNFIVASCVENEDFCNGKTEAQDIRDFTITAQHNGGSTENIRISCCEGQLCNDGVAQQIKCNSYNGLAKEMKPSSQLQQCTGKTCVTLFAGEYTNTGCSDECEPAKGKESLKWLEEQNPGTKIVVQQMTCCRTDLCNTGVNDANTVNGANTVTTAPVRKNECNVFVGLKTEMAEKKTKCETGQTCITVTNKQYVATSCAAECSDSEKHELKGKLYDATAKLEAEEARRKALADLYGSMSGSMYGSMYGTSGGNRKEEEKTTTMREADMRTGCCDGPLCNDGNIPNNGNEGDEENSGKSLSSLLPLTLSLTFLVYNYSML